MHLVWGPPGTGKTKVIAQSLQDLVAEGKSVLLVSMTNIAVDNALAKAAAAISPAPGVMVRVGTPHLTAIAQNSAVNLQRLVDERQAGPQPERHRLEERISVLSADPAAEARGVRGTSGCSAIEANGGCTGCASPAPTPTASDAAGASRSPTSGERGTNRAAAGPRYAEPRTGFGETRDRSG